jgi:PAS domain S-box-containing protein
MRLRTQLFAGLAVAWVLCLSSLYVVIRMQSEKTFRTDLAADLGRESTEVIAELDRFMTERQIDLHFLGLCPEVLSLDRERITEELSHLRDANTCYEWLRVMDIHGVVLADTNQMGIGEVAMATPPATDRSVEFLSLATNYGMNARFRQRTTAGWIEAVVPLQRLRHRMSDKANWPAGTLVELVEGERLLFANVSDAGVAQSALAAMQRVDLRPGIPHWLPDGSLVLATANTTGWQLRAQVPASAWQQRLEPITHAILVVALIGAVWGSALVWWLTGRLSRPLVALADQAHQLGGAARLALPEGQASDPAEVQQLRVALQQMIHEIGLRLNELELANQRMRLAATAAHLGVWDFHPHSGALLWDEGMRSVYGANQATLTGQVTDWTSRVLPEDLPAAQAGLAKSIAEQRQFTQRFRIRRDDGAIRWIEASSAPHLDHTGKMISVVGVNLDATERIEADMHLRSALEAAEAANRAKSEFLAVMSHELRTPLNGVIGVVELLASSGLSTEQAEMARIIRNSGEVLLSIISDILEYSRIESGRLEFRNEPFSPVTVLEEIVALIRPQAATKGFPLVLICGPDTPPQLVGDRTRFAQVLFNLIGNAVKFTESGCVTVATTCDATHFRISIADTGIGIAASDLNKIFKRFSQVDSTMSRRFGGTGLGLAISDGLIRAMGGSITVTSQPGHGSIFSVLLPLALFLPQPTTPPQETADEVLPAPQARAAATATAALMRPLHVLVAEDNPINQRVTELMLHRLGHTLQCVDDGEAALSTWRAGSFDAVLMDLQMPVMDGLEAARAMRGAELPGHHIPIIAVTANIRESDRAACLAAGMDAVISKPLTHDSLSAALCQVCGDCSRPPL